MNIYFKKTLIAFSVACALMLFDEVCAFDLNRLQATLIGKFGSSALSNFLAWQSMMHAVQDKSNDDKIKRVNEFFNRRIAWGEDQVVWGQLDYWATPMDTLGKGAGDCEDFAIAKVMK